VKTSVTAYKIFFAWSLDVSQLSKLTQTVRLLAFIRKESGSNLGYNTDYDDRGFFCGFPQPFQGNADIVL
jgi:hypothetical protein